MLNSIPVLGWILSLIFAASAAVPFWICWTACGLGARYFYFLPPVYQAVPFWHCVGLAIVVSILKGVLVPKLATVTQTTGEKKS